MFWILYVVEIYLMLGFIYYLDVLSEFDDMAILLECM